MAMHFTDSNKGYIKSDSSISKSLEGIFPVRIVDCGGEHISGMRC
jgi:hypothetical protein